MDSVKLVTIGGGIHAVFYRSGEPVRQSDLGREAYVRVPSDEELADRPRSTPEFAEHSGGCYWLSFAGFYVVPGSGLAAIFGAIPDAYPAS